MFNDVQPSMFPAPSRLVVIGDVHGDVQRFLQCLYAVQVLNQNLEWIAEPKDTVVVQLGDQIDSACRGGENGAWEKLPDTEMLVLTDRLDEIARLHGGRVLSLLGNHELMNVLGDFAYVSPFSLEKTGGAGQRRKMFLPGGSMAHLLSKRNLVIQIGSYICCHAGLLPHHVIMVNGKLHSINVVARKLLRGEALTFPEQQICHEVIHNPQGILWTRAYMEMLAAQNMHLLNEVVEDVLEKTCCKRIVVGHNTVEAVSVFCNGKLMLVDTGLSRAYSSKSFQFLDIWKPGMDDEAVRVVNIDAMAH